MKYNSDKVRQALPRINRDICLFLYGMRKEEKVSFKFVKENSNSITCEDPTYQQFKQLLPCSKKWLRQLQKIKSVSNRFTENYSEFPNSVSQDLKEPSERDE